MFNNCVAVASFDGSARELSFESRILLDPTDGIVGNRDLIRVGVARDPYQALPLHGTYRGKATDFTGMTVDVQVTSTAIERSSDNTHLFNSV